MTDLHLLPPGDPPEPVEMRPQSHGGELRSGNPGNAGNPNGRTPRIPVKERAGRALRALLIDLEERIEAARKGEGPKLSTRDAVAYARLCAEVEARDLPGDKPPVRVMVLSATEADMRAALAEPVVEQADAIEGDEVRELLGTGDPPAP